MGTEAWQGRRWVTPGACGDTAGHGRDGGLPMANALLATFGFGHAKELPGRKQN